MRRLLLVPLLFALVAPVTAAPAHSAAPAAVIEFLGSATLGCLNCDGPHGIDASAVVTYADGRVVPARFVAEVWEDTTPDPCPFLLQAFGEYSVDGMTGWFSWLRSTNELVLTAENGAGVAAVVADPVHLALAACGFENETYPVAGTLVLS